MPGQSQWKQHKNGNRGRHLQTDSPENDQGGFYAEFKEGPSVEFLDPSFKDFRTSPGYQWQNRHGDRSSKGTYKVNREVLKERKISALTNMRNIIVFTLGFALISVGSLFVKLSKRGKINKKQKTNKKICFIYLILASITLLFAELCFLQVELNKFG